MKLKRVCVFMAFVLIYTSFSEEYGFKQNKEPFYYRMNWKGDSSMNKDEVSEKKKRGVNVSVEGRVAYGAEVKINCFPSPDYDNNTEIIWRKNGGTILRGRTLIIKKYEKESFGKYLCEVQTKGGGIQRRSIDLTPEKDSETTIEMTPDPGRFYNFSLGRTKELYCHISKNNRAKKLKSKEIIWKFQDKAINDVGQSSQSRSTKRFVRLDRRSGSILLLKDMDQDNEGSYKCFQDLSVFTAHMILKRDILVSVTPDSQTWTDNINETAEFMCKINTPGIKSRFIRWSFKPKHGEKEEALPREAKMENTETLSTSYLVIENVNKKHEGVYACQVLKEKALSKLIIESKQDSRLQSKKIFSCQMSRYDGKILWRREYKEDSLINQGQIMEGGYNSSSESRVESTSGDGALYECGFGLQINQFTKEMNESKKSILKVKRELDVKEIKIDQLRKEMNESMKEIENMKKERIKMKKEMNLKEIKIDELRRDINTLRNDRRLDSLNILEIQKKLLKEQSEKDKLNTEINLLKEMKEEIKKSKEEREQTTNFLNKSFPNFFSNKLRKKLNVDFVWTFERISERVGKVMFSDPFESNNYRMCLRMFIYTDGTIWIGVTLLKGEKDNLLTWPLKRSVIVSLLDQDSLNSVETLTIKYDTFKYNKEAFQKAKDERNAFSIIDSLVSEKYDLIKGRPTDLARDSLLISCLISQ